MMEMRTREGNGLQYADPDALHQHAAAYGIAFYGPQLATEATAHERWLVLLGEPGSGKSTMLRYLALTLAEAGLDHTVDPAERLLGWNTLGEQQRLLPVFYPLLRFSRWLTEHPAAHGTAEDLWTAIADYIDPAHSSTSLAGIVRQRLHSGELLLLLDGLDEVATADARRNVVNAVRQFGTQHGQCRIVVTCRVRAYLGEQNRDWQLPGWTEAMLADWNLAQMQSFVDAWYHEAAPSMEPARRATRIEAIQQALAARAELRLIGQRPLLLTIMALVHLNDGHLPKDTPALLSRCIDILLAQWEGKRDDGSEYGTLMEYIGLPDLSVQHLRPLLEAAAFLAHDAATRGSEGFLRRADLFDLVGRELKHLKHPEPWNGSERFLDYTDKRAGLLYANDAGDSYAFPLQTFQEYLAGRKLVSGVDPVAEMLARRNDDRWYRPLVFGLGDQVANKSLNVPFRFFSKVAQRQRC